MSNKRTWNEMAENTLSKIEEWLQRWPTEQHWLGELQATRGKGEEATYELLIYAGFQEAEAKRYSKSSYKPTGDFYTDPSFRWKGIVSRKGTIEKEKRGRARYGLQLDGCDYLDALEILDAGCDLKQAREMLKQGKTKEEIINALEKEETMTDSKSEPNNPKYLVTEEQHQEAWSEVRLEEACRKAIYHLRVYQGYGRRDASDIVHELSTDWTEDEIEETIKKGITDKIREEAIKLLTERGAVKKKSEGIEPSPL